MNWGEFGQSRFLVVQEYHRTSRTRATSLSSVGKSIKPHKKQILSILSQPYCRFRKSQKSDPFVSLWMENRGRLFGSEETNYTFWCTTSHKRECERANERVHEWTRKSEEEESREKLPKNIERRQRLRQPVLTDWTFTRVCFSEESPQFPLNLSL